MDGVVMRSVWISVAAAALLWFVMFSPWTAPCIPFWPLMSVSAIFLTLLALHFGGNPFSGKLRPLSSVAMGVGMAIVLWCLFWLGDKVSQFLFSFARPQVDAIYDMGDDFPRWGIALLLLFVIGPAEEVFWRGFVQRRMSLRWGAWQGFLLSTLCYTAVHVWSGNLMLLFAAAACGFCWGMLYCLMPKRLPALIVSHALWDAAAFVFFPF